MKQVIQSYRTGKLALKEVPEPKVRPGHLLVRTRASVISVGTERMTIDFAKKNLASKAMARPDLIKKMAHKAKRDGIVTAVRTVVARLDEPLPLGYSAAGEVLAVGAGLEGAFRVGGRVAIAGAGLANHAELNVVPGSLAAKVPDDVPAEHAAFGTIGAIALHAVRNLGLGIGDIAAVVGVGLIGQLACQFLNLSGIRVLALDYNTGRLQLARDLGAEAARDLGDGGLDGAVAALTGGCGCDGVLIAAATESDEPFETAACIARDRARVVMVGMTGTEFPYAAFMKKELNIVVSRSYGPGRYDADFEARNVKYPEGWVRWTETENLAEALRLMAPGRTTGLNVGALITGRYAIDEAKAAYELVTAGYAAHLGVVLNYPTREIEASGPIFKPAKAPASVCSLGVIGAGAFAKSVLLPELKKINGIRLHTLATQRGASAEHGQQTFGFEAAAADEAAVFDNPDITAILVATRHDSHAELTARALEAGKAVLVEKPLALTLDEVNRVIEARNAAAEGSGAFFQVGFNRRFASMTRKVRDGLAGADGPAVVLIRVNAGTLPADHWAQTADEGGGRILGEVCHFVDLARFLTGSAITSVHAEAAAAVCGHPCDDVSAQLSFVDGSLATIVYTSRGDETAGKERIEAYAGGRSYTIDDYRRLTVFGAPGSGQSRRQDKGITGALKAFTQAVATGSGPPLDEGELIETTAATIAVMESLRSGTRIDL